MMKRFIKYILVVLTPLFFTQCIYDFEPEDFWDVEETIVIEGDIIVGDESRFRVSKTIALSDDEYRNILNASVWVEDAEGNKWQSSGMKDDFYLVNTTDLDLNGSYKLCVEVPQRGLYESALRDVILTPQIDSVSYIVGDDNSLSIYVTTHGDEDSRYYRWDYEEDWKYTSKYMGELDYLRDEWKMVKISYEEKMKRYYCWAKDHVGVTKFASTEDLSENLMYMENIRTIYNNDYRLSSMYSILVKQTSLDKEGYTYWETLRKNSNELGGLFAPQPSELRGNIVSRDNPKEFVLGYVNVSTISKERIFVNCREMSLFSWPWKDDVFLLPRREWRAFDKLGYKPMYYERTNRELVDTAYWTSDPRCVDCRKMGSIPPTSKPSFWPED